MTLCYILFNAAWFAWVQLYASIGNVEDPIKKPRNDAIKTSQYRNTGQCIAVLGSLSLASRTSYCQSQNVFKLRDANENDQFRRSNCTLSFSFVPTSLQDMLHHLCDVNPSPSPVSSQTSSNPPTTSIPAQSSHLYISPSFLVVSQNNFNNTHLRTTKKHNYFHVLIKNILLVMNSKFFVLSC